MKSISKISKITIIINKAYSGRLIDFLHELGIERIFVETGRSSILGQGRGIFGLAQAGKLVYDPAEIISVLVAKELESALMSLVAKEFELSTPGRGAIFSTPLIGLKAHEDYLVYEKLKEMPSEDQHFFDELVGLDCIVQRSEGDVVARIALNAGASVPYTSYGTGTGVRDKLGLLRITIPADKEIISLVMSKYDVDQVLEMYISEAKLDEPGRGIAYIYPLGKGLMNTRISSSKASQAASMEQIISAIDSIKGGIEWRKAGMEAQSLSRRSFLTGMCEIGLVCADGEGQRLSMVAMENGAGGATISKISYQRPMSEGKQESSACEYSRMIVANVCVDQITEALEKEGAFTSEIKAMMMIKEVEKAFTYIARK
ncbi:MAG: hypothetical protein ACOCG6_06240 [Candidatus Cloacimonadaceae bacterium]